MVKLQESCLLRIITYVILFILITIHVTPEPSAVTRGVSDNRGSTVVEKHGTCSKQTELGWRPKATHCMGGLHWVHVI